MKTNTTFHANVRPKIESSLTLHYSLFKVFYESLSADNYEWPKLDYLQSFQIFFAKLGMFQNGFFHKATKAGGRMEYEF
jgi:hypothetical protein